MAEKKESRLEAAKISKKRRRDLEEEVSIRWGEYDLDIPTRNAPGIEEISNFLQELDKRSSYPQTIAATCLHKGKLEIIENLSSYPLISDIIVTRTLDQLDKVLRDPFDKPILYRPKRHQHDLGIKGFLEWFSKNKNSALHVYDCSIADASQRTRNTTVDEALRAFPSSPDANPLNFLDIENRTGAFYCPAQITQHDIQTRIAHQKQENVGKIGSTWISKKPSEFFLLSTRNAVSSIHIDNGGQLTWVRVLEGRKIWYFPQSLGMKTLRWLSVAGSQSPEHYRGGWVKVELHAGDIL